MQESQNKRKRENKNIIEIKNCILLSRNVQLIAMNDPKKLNIPSRNLHPTK